MTDDRVERQIQKLQQDGALDGLPGHGRPFSDLDEPYDPMWWIKKKLRMEGFDVLPPALDIRRRVERFLEALSELESEDAVVGATEELNRLIAKTNATTIRGPETSLALLDPKAVVDRWRRLRVAEA